MPQINQRELLLQLSMAEPVLVKEALRVAKEQFFDPAVKQMEKDFEKDAVTRELVEGVDAVNYSKTLGDLGHREGRNLYSFIGFTDGDDPLESIRERLDPEHPDGPKLKYVRGSQARNLVFQFQILAPNKGAIYSSTPMPWANGISWAERIELGIPGVTRFLNKTGLKGSRSGGGIQVKNDIRQARFNNRSYLSKIFGDFIARF